MLQTRKVISLLILVQRANTNGIQSALDSFRAVPEVLAQERPHHVERRDRRVAGPELVVAFPGGATPERLRIALLKCGKETPGRSCSSLVEDASLGEM